MDVDEIPVGISMYAAVEASEFLWDIVAITGMISRAPETELKLYDNDLHDVCFTKYGTIYGIRSHRADNHSPRSSNEGAEICVSSGSRIPTYAYAAFAIHTVVIGVAHGDVRLGVRHNFNGWLAVSEGLYRIFSNREIRLSLRIRV